MIRRLWVLGWWGVAIFWATALVTALSAAWFQSGRLAAVMVVLLVAAITGTVPMAMWSDPVESNPPKPNLPRAVRKKLREEQRRIALEKAIRDLEIEAGIS